MPKLLKMPPAGNLYVETFARLGRQAIRDEATNRLIAWRHKCLAPDRAVDDLIARELGRRAAPWMATLYKPARVVPIGLRRGEA